MKCADVDEGLSMQQPLAAARNSPEPPESSNRSTLLEVYHDANSLSSSIASRQPRDNRRGSSRAMFREELTNISSIASQRGLTIEPGRRESCSNAVHTYRFSWYSWLPKSFYLQFQRCANIYFVIVAILSVTVISGAATKTAVVLCVMMLQSLKDGYEDLKRRRDDRKENEEECQIFDGRCFQSRLWQECGLGSIVKVMRGEKIPADVLVIISSDSSGEFFVSTASFDGEANLKQRMVPKAFMDVIKDFERAPSVEGGGARGDAFVSYLLNKDWRLQILPPEASLDTMDASIFLPDSNTSLDLDNFALRGSELRNTAWVIGIACHVGQATKIRMNSSACPAKQSHLEAHLNRCVVGILIAIGSVSALFANLGMIPGNQKSNTNSSGIRLFSMVFLKYLVMLWAVLPITLYILFEILHLIFGWRIDFDEAMKDEESEEYARARNTSVIEDMGQVSFVFSDKTGTLTANEMSFAFCFVGGRTFGSFLPSSSEYEETLREVRELLHAENSHMQNMLMLFFQALAICHNVQFEKNDDDGNLASWRDAKLQATSPDELALVEVAKDVGVRWSGRERNADLVANDNILRIGWQGMPAKTYEPGELGGTKAPVSDQSSPPFISLKFVVSHEIPFSSDRKRMSVIIREDTGHAVVLVKGADSVMGRRLTALPRGAEAAIHSFALQGLRTLVLGYRRLDPETYWKWSEDWKAAMVMVDKNEKENRLKLVHDFVETGLTFIGVTAVEDRLQDKVPETISKLREAGVHVWVLTGDKVETAVEIAKACKLFECHPRRDHYIVSDDVQDEHLSGKIKDALKGALQAEVEMHIRGLVLDGRAVGAILQDRDMTKDLFELGMKCISCVCCRLSPLQKKQLVEMVRKTNSKLVTLSIGDGANDVPMIQGAHIGIGIRGKEGSASVLASDVAISQFKFLQNLMFDHGRKSYRRVAMFLGYFMYKSMALGCAYVIHAFFENFHGDAPFASLLDATYAPLTSWSVALMVAFDRDEGDVYEGEERAAFRDPFKFYRYGTEEMGFNIYMFAKWMATAVVHGSVVWIASVWSIATWDECRDNKKKFWIASYNAFSVLLVVVHVKLAYLSDWKIFYPLFPWSSNLGGSSSTHWFTRLLDKSGALALLAELLAYVVGCAGFGWLLASGFIRFDASASPPSGGPLAPFCNNCDGNLNVPFEAVMYWQVWACLFGIPLILLAFDIVMRAIKMKCKERREEWFHCPRCPRQFLYESHQDLMTRPSCCNCPYTRGKKPQVLYHWTQESRNLLLDEDPSPASAPATLRNLLQNHPDLEEPLSKEEIKEIEKATKLKIYDRALHERAGITMIEKAGLHDRFDEAVGTFLSHV